MFTKGWQYPAYNLIRAAVEATNSWLLVSVGNVGNTGNSDGAAPRSISGIFGISDIRILAQSAGRDGAFEPAVAGTFHAVYSRLIDERAGEGEEGDRQVKRKWWEWHMSTPAGRKVAVLENMDPFR